VVSPGQAHHGGDVHSPAFSEPVDHRPGRQVAHQESDQHTAHQTRFGQTRTERDRHDRKQRRRRPARRGEQRGQQEHLLAEPAPVERLRRFTHR
jgi:hypothetical protein